MFLDFFISMVGDWSAVSATIPLEIYLMAGRLFLYFMTMLFIIISVTFINMVYSHNRKGRF